MKILLDYLGAMAALVLLAPVLVLVALLVRLRLGKPVLFRHVRPGRGGKPFVLYKFRTMTEGRDALGKMLPDEDRLTRFGKFLRNTSLDELPELFNVLKGEMSLVGPRPLIMEYLERYTPEQARRHEVKPGVTGWAQINGRNAIDWEERFRLDVWYVDHQTLCLDLKILLKTVRKVIARENIHMPGYATSPFFMGSHDTSDEVGPEVTVWPK